MFVRCQGKRRPTPAAGGGGARTMGCVIIRFTVGGGAMIATSPLSCLGGGVCATGRSDGRQIKQMELKYKDDQVMACSL